MRLLASLLLAGVLVLLTGTPATAHASLIESDPEDGSVVATLPEQVVLTFNEPVRLGGADAVRGFGPDGGDWAVDARAQDNRVVVTPVDDPGQGTVVIAWKVISEDGHEVTGGLTFAIGATSGGAAAAAAAPESPVAVDVARWAAVAIAGLALVMLAALVAVVVLRPTLPASWTHRGVHHTLTGVWYGAFLAALLFVPLQEIARQGRGLGALKDWLVWLDGLTDARSALLLGSTVLAVGLVSAGRHGSRPAHRSPRWTVLWAGTTVAVVLVIAGALVVSPEPEGTPAAAAPPAAGPSEQATELGDSGTVELMVTPADGREHRLDVRLLDPDGRPLRPFATPTLAVSNGDIDLGEHELRRTGAGEYRTTATIPQDGSWIARVSVRVDEFTNPVVDIPFEVSSPTSEHHRP